MKKKGPTHFNNPGRICQEVKHQWFHKVGTVELNVNMVNTYSVALWSESKSPNTGVMVKRIKAPQNRAPAKQPNGGQQKLHVLVYTLPFKVKTLPSDGDKSHQSSCCGKVVSQYAMNVECTISLSLFCFFNNASVIFIK